MERFSAIPDEVRLTRKASEGDQDAFSALYSYYYPRLYQHLSFMCGSGEDADEIVQEVFLKCWQSRESLSLVRSFKGYIFTMSKNLLFDHLRRAKTKRRMEAAVSPEGNEDYLPENLLIYRQYYTIAQQAIGRLSPNKQKIFLLRTQEGLKLDQIAREMGLSRATVKKHLYEAITSVKRDLSMHADWTDTLLSVFLIWNTVSPLAANWRRHL